MRSRFNLVLIACAFLGWPTCRAQSTDVVPRRVIELTADKDSRYRQGHKVAPVIAAFPGERLILRITAVRAKEVARDGSVHGLALLDKNSDVVPGWRFFLQPGVQDLAVTAPVRPARYNAVCIVICSDGHEGMGFTLVVSEPGKKVKE